ncbi:PEP-CTERM sorting domain-containing protein [Phycisphaeraceae bacterium D3-23]
MCNTLHRHTYPTATILAAALALSAALPTNAADQTATWDGSDGNWSDAARWSTDPLFPDNGNGGNTFDAIINSGDVTLDQDITLEGLSLGGGDIDGSFDLTITGTLDWLLGQMLGAGTTTLAAGGTLTTGGSTQTLRRDFDNAGTVQYHNGNFRLADDAVFTNLAGAVFNASDPSGIPTGGGGGGTFNNNGTFNKTTASSFRITAGEFNNAGSVNIDEGELRISSGGANTGTFEVDAGATLRFEGSYTYSPGSSITGVGTVTFDNGTHVLPAGTFTPTGTVNFEDGSITVNDVLTPAALGAIGADVTFNQFLDFGGPLTVNSSGSAAFSAAQSFTQITLDNGDLGGTGDLTITGTLDWLLGQMLGAGTTTLAAGGTLTTGGSTQTLRRDFDNAGTVQYHNGNFRLADDAVFTNLAGAVFNASDPSGIPTGGGGGGTFHNNGTFNKTTASSFRITAGEFNNAGSVNIDEGELRISSGGANTGTFEVDAGATLRFEGSYTYSPGSSITGVGTVTFDNGTHVLPAGTFTPTGTVNFEDGSITVNDVLTPAALGAIGADVTFNQFLDFGGPLTVNSSGSAAFSAAQSFTQITLDNGDLGGTGDLTITGTLDWLLGQMLGAGTTTLAAGGTLTTGGSTQTLRRDFDNAGTVQYHNGNFRLADDAVFTNLAGAVFNASDPSGIPTGGGGGGTFNNNGTFNKTTASSFRITAGEFNNAGSVNIDEGELDFSQAYTQTAGKLTVDAGAEARFTTTANFTGGQITGGGTIIGDINNQGAVVAPGTSPGTLTLDGDYTHGTGASLQIQFGGTQSGAFDVFDVTGDAELEGGMLEVVLLNADYSIAQGATFDVMLAGAIAGQFDTVILPTDMVGGTLFSSQVDPLGRVTLTALSDFEMVLGDITGDLFVGVEDLDVLLANWGDTVGFGNNSIAAGDLSGDGVVGQADLQIVIDNWGGGTSPDTNIPEPGSLALLGLGGLALLRRRR